MTVSDFVNDISSTFERGRKTIGIFVDLLKVFDTINYNITLHKLSYYLLEEYLKICSKIISVTENNELSITL